MTTLATTGGGDIIVGGPAANIQNFCGDCWAAVFAGMGRPGRASLGPIVSQMFARLLAPLRQSMDGSWAPPPPRPTTTLNIFRDTE